MLPNLTEQASITYLIVMVLQIVSLGIYYLCDPLPHSISLFLNAIEPFSCP